jgi:hypothetical protein
VRVISDVGAAERTFREARHDAPALLAWGPTLAHYLVWVDPDGGLGSALLLDPMAVDQVERIKASFLDRLDRPINRQHDGREDEDADALPIVMLSLADYLDGTVGGPGYGNFGQPPDRCRPAGELWARARTDLAPSVQHRA